MVEQAQEAAIDGYDPELDTTGRDTVDSLEFRFEEQEVINTEADGRDADGDMEAGNPAERLDAYATNTAARLVDRSGRRPFGSRLSGRMALLYLMRADWQFQLALDTLNDNLNAGDEELILDAEEEELADEEEAERSEAHGLPRLIVRPQTRAPNATQVNYSEAFFTMLDVNLCGRLGLRD